MSFCVRVNASKQYDVIIRRGLLNECGRELTKLGARGKICLVTDDTVDALYSARAAASFASSGFETVKFVIPHGERSKSAEMLIALLRFLAENDFTGSDTVAALGGGVTGDLSGLAASLYRRGVRLVQMPTTLLAAVDSSVGGKTAIDIPEGKNLVGSFYQPSLVLCDVDAFSTLPETVFSEGCAEMIKYGVIYDAELFSLLSDKAYVPSEEAVARCVSIKRDVVEKDERDLGLRRILNFGHTVGHAIELLSDYTVSHGNAVAAGMAVVTKASVKSGFCPEECYTSLIKLLELYGLPTGTKHSAEELKTGILRDKKRFGDTISFIVPEKIGSCREMKLPTDKIEEFVAKGL